MKRHLQLQQCYSTKRFDARSWAVEVPIAASEVVPLVCEITLLLYSRSEQLSLLYAKGKKLIVSVVEGNSAVSGSEETTVCLKLIRRDAEFILCFLLTWYRDGAPATNHIDVELVGSKSAGPDCTLVIKAENSRAR